MPPDADRPAFPEPPPSTEPAPSAADNVRNAMLGIGSIGLELASLGADPPWAVVRNCATRSRTWNMRSGD